MALASLISLGQQDIYLGQQDIYLLSRIYKEYRIQKILENVKYSYIVNKNLFFEEFENERKYSDIFMEEMSTYSYSFKELQYCSLTELQFCYTKDKTLYILHHGLIMILGIQDVQRVFQGTSYQRGNLYVESKKKIYKLKKKKVDANDILQFIFIRDIHMIIKEYYNDSAL